MSTLAFLNLMSQNSLMACCLGYNPQISWQWDSFKIPWNILCNERTKHISVLQTEEEYQVVVGGKVALIFSLER